MMKARCMTQACFLRQAIAGTVLLDGVCSFILLRDGSQLQERCVGQETVGVSS